MSKIDCSHAGLLEIHKIQPNPKNPNKHSQAQIKRLAEIIDYQGQRHPIVISNRSGFVVAGHGRLEAIKLLGWEKCAVDFQDFDSDAQEYAFIVSDNAIAEWAELDISLIELEIETNQDLKIELLGIEDFKPIEILPPEEYGDKNKEIDTENFGNDLQQQCPKCGFEFNS